MPLWIMSWEQEPVLEAIALYCSLFLYSFVFSGTGVSLAADAAIKMLKAGCNPAFFDEPTSLL